MNNIKCRQYTSTHHMLTCFWLEDNHCTHPKRKTIICENIPQFEVMLNQRKVELLNKVNTRLTGVKQ